MMMNLILIARKLLKMHLKKNFRHMFPKYMMMREEVTEMGLK
jgi:hypothetical protein